MKGRHGSCWGRKSALEKILIFTSTVLLCLAVALSVIVVYPHGHHFQNLTPIEAGPSTCLQPKCTQAAAQILDIIDPSIDPCDNFYDFACGTFLKKSIERKEVNPFSRFQAITTNRIEELITQPIAEPIEKPLQLQRKFYNSCMNITAIEEDNNYALIDLIVKVGEWPVRLGRLWNRQKFHWLRTMVKCRNSGAGYEYFFKIRAVHETINGTEMMVLAIRPPQIMKIPPLFQKYYEEMMTNISLALMAVSYRYANQEFIRVMDFQEQLQSFIKEEEAYGQKKLVQIEYLQREYPTIPWIDFLNNITVTAVPFTSSTWIRFEAGLYLNNLIKLVLSIPETTQANYVIWNLVESYGNYLNEEQRIRYVSFLTSLAGDDKIKNRKGFCLNAAKKYFPSVVEVAYLRKYVPQDVRNDIKGMISRIKSQLISRMQKNDWLDDKSKNSSEIKLEKIQWLIGASESVYNDNFEKTVNMEKFELKTDNVVEMIQTLKVRMADNYFRYVNRNLSEIRNEIIGTSPILNVDTLYNQRFNTLDVFAPFLQGIIYDFDHPQYMNYGALGSVIGHEFTRGLLSQDNKFETVWPPGTREEYSKRTECLLNEYQNYTAYLQDFTNDGTIALSESLADLIGSNLAYEAYQKWAQYYPTEVNLPSLNYTPNQIFWIMFGAVKCHQPRLNEVNDHGVPSFGVTFSVKNSPDFAKDFNCPADSKMNPSTKCHIL